MPLSLFLFPVTDKYGNAIEKALVDARQTDGVSAPLGDFFTAEDGVTPVSWPLETNSDGLALAWGDTPQSLDVFVTDNGGTAHVAGHPGILRPFPDEDPVRYYLHVVPEDEGAGGGGAVDSVDGRTGVVTLGDIYVEESDHTKATHDALLIDADTVDGEHAAAFEHVADKGASDGYAPLVGGLLPTTHLPALSITDVYMAADEAAMLALAAQRGDVAIREDIDVTFILATDDPTLLANWKQLPIPPDAVLSINGQTGVVVLAKGDVGLGNVDNTSDLNKPVSTATQIALDGKSATGHTHTVADSKSAVISNPVVGNLLIWRAPFPLTVTKVWARREGGTGATVNVRKNQTDAHLASDLSLASADTVTDGGAVQNTAYAAGDTMELMIPSLTGTVTEIMIQVDFTRTV